MERYILPIIYKHKAATIVVAAIISDFFRAPPPACPRTGFSGELSWFYLSFYAMPLAKFIFGNLAVIASKTLI